MSCQELATAANPFYRLPMRFLAMLIPIVLCAAGCSDPIITSTTQLADTQNELGPYQVTTVLNGAQPNDKVELFFNVTDDSSENYIPIRMEPLETDGRAADLFVGSIPGQPSGTTIRYYVAVDRDGARVDESPVGGDLKPFMLSILPPQM